MMTMTSKTGWRVALAAACFVGVVGTPAFTQQGANAQGDAISIQLSDYRGLAMPSEAVTLSAPVDGVLRSLRAEEGAAVKAGERVAQMDNAVQSAVVETARVRSVSDAAIQRAQAELDAATAELERMRATRAKGAGSAVELLRMEARFDAAEAGLDQAHEEQAIARWTLRLEEARLAEYALRAPFDGVVTKHEASAGASLAQATPVVTLVKLDPLEAEVFLPVSLGLPEAGRRYVLNAGAPVGRVIEAELTWVSPVIDPASRMFRCKFTIANDDFALPAGFDVSLVSLEPVPEALADVPVE